MREKGGREGGREGERDNDSSEVQHTLAAAEIPEPQRDGLSSLTHSPLTHSPLTHSPTHSLTTHSLTHSPSVLPRKYRVVVN